MPFKKGNTFGGRRGPRKQNLDVARSPSTPRTRRESERRVPEDVVVDDDDDDGEDDEPEAEGTGQEEVDNEAATPGQDEDEDDADTPPTITTIPRRRRGRGGPRTSSRAAINTPEQGDEGSESGTPLKRRRGRPPGSGSGRGRGGFRGRRRGAQAEAPRVVDANGTVHEVVDDEALVDDDDDGNAKVDEKGHLQGGRQYRVRTFTIVGRDDRLYMLSTEPARCCGFRDSYLFFTKHPKLYKVLIGDEEKRDLIDRDILPSSYKGRNIGVVTARSVFREFGARIVVGGRRVTDDYKVAEARANGVVEGELADPEDRIPDGAGEYDRNRYVAWFGASEVYRTATQGGSSATNKPGLSGKRRNNITVQNWQSMHAREASRFNTSLTALRRSNLDGVYDTNTNMMFYPKIMQPTHAKWEQVPPPSSQEATDKPQPLPNGQPNDHLEEPSSSSDNITTTAPAPMTTTTTTIAPAAMDLDPSPPADDPTPFAPVAPVISRNFAIVDTTFLSPSISNAGYPGPGNGLGSNSSSDFTSGTPGLSAIPDALLAELPAECRAALEHARGAEVEWKARWGTEAQAALRGHLRVGFNGYPV